jgi:hypothetical protein
MNRFWAFLVLLSAASLTMACGSSSSNRQLQSITISSTVSGQQVRFTATGTFSAPPTTVSPLPVSDWGIGPFAPPPENVQYTLTTQPFVFDCTGSGAPNLPVSTLAPSDPNAPTTGSLPFAKMVTATASIPCP